MKDLLNDRWHRLWDRHNVPNSLSVPAFERLYAHYNDSARGYHDPSHLEQLFRVFDGVAPLMYMRDQAEAAIFYHDVIIDHSRTDNELKSAEYMRADLAAFGLSGLFQLYAGDLVLATDHVGHVHENDQKFIRDIDLSSLAGSWESICRSARGLRHEEPELSLNEFVEKQRQKLENFLQRDHLFCTQFFRNHHEKRARANIELEIKLLPEILKTA